MALIPSTNVVDTAGPGSDKRVFPEMVQTKQFASGSGTLAHLTPVARNTSTGNFSLYQAAGSNGTNIIGGFIIRKEGHTLSGSGETLGEVMQAGRIHIDDIPIVSGYTLADLQAAARDSSLRHKGLIIEGVSNSN